ncbi:Hypothetical protein HVR_LOCUS899 [uncultured virus]|nr:Hypothetical protein HVR_LOCUS899 [uncultured virus]
MFDKDDGFDSAFDKRIADPLTGSFGKVNSEDFDYMTDCFNKWKSADYAGNLSDYCDK